jgi:hypothetical protein
MMAGPITATITFDGATTPPEYDVGDTTRVAVLFRDEEINAPVDPGTVRAKIGDPRGAIKTFTYPASPELTKLSTGSYRIELSLDQAGEWCVRFEGLAVNRASGERHIKVRESCFYTLSGAELPDAP